MLIQLFTPKSCPYHFYIHQWTLLPPHLSAYLKCSLFREISSSFFTSLLSFVIINVNHFTPYSSNSYLYTHSYPNAHNVPFTISSLFSSYELTIVSPSIGFIMLFSICLHNSSRYIQFIVNEITSAKQETIVVNQKMKIMP